jgi:hypothetical protein
VQSFVVSKEFPSPIELVAAIAGISLTFYPCAVSI